MVEKFDWWREEGLSMVSILCFDANGGLSLSQTQWSFVFFGDMFVAIHRYRDLFSRRDCRESYTLVFPGEERGIKKKVAWLEKQRDKINSAHMLLPCPWSFSLTPTVTTIYLLHLFEEEVEVVCGLILVVCHLEIQRVKLFSSLLCVEKKIACSIFASCAVNEMAIL